VTQLLRAVGVERCRLKGGDRPQTLGVEEQATVAQVIPAEELGAAQGAPPGSRTSITTGKTWDSARMA
jgi:hypothetical protein